MESRVAPPGKRCSKCGKNKPLTSFASHATNADRRRGECRACAKKADAKRWATSPERRDKSRKAARAHRFRTAYGITVEQYEEMFAAQGGHCLICSGQNAGQQKLHVDHCHDTGVIRGLLCNRCNGGIGLFDDSPGILLAAVAYLQRFKDD